MANLSKDANLKAKGYQDTGLMNVDIPLKIDLINLAKGYLDIVTKRPLNTGVVFTTGIKFREEFNYINGIIISCEKWGDFYYSIIRIQKMSKGMIDEMGEYMRRQNIVFKN